MNIKITNEKSAAWRERAIGELARDHPSFMQLFNRFGLDYCCQGKLSLADACKQAGVDEDELLIGIYQQQSSSPELNKKSPSKFETVEELVKYLTTHHHAFTRETLSQLEPLVEKIYQVHGENHPELATVKVLFSQLYETLQEHLTEEENVWFPHMVRLSQGHSVISRHSCCGPRHDDSPECLMTQEHLEVATLLKGLHEATDNYVPPAGACSTYQRTYQLLNELEQDLHQHIHLENNVLLPQVKALDDARVNDALLRVHPHEPLIKKSVTK